MVIISISGGDCVEFDNVKLQSSEATQSKIDFTVTHVMGNVLGESFNCKINYGFDIIDQIVQYNFFCYVLKYTLCSIIKYLYFDSIYYA